MSIVKNIKSLGASFSKNYSSIIASIKSGNQSEEPGKYFLSNSNKSMPSILSKDFEIIGEISSAGIIEIEGKVKGKIRGNSIVIREEGWVEGTIEVDSISIRGKFHGEMKARNISIFKKAKIIGNIEYSSLSVEDGAFVEGQFKQVSDRKSVKKPIIEVVNSVES